MKGSILFLMACVSAASVYAQSRATAPITEAEFRLLPPYCAARLKGGTAAQKAQFEAQLGTNNFLHIHHYCMAANLANRIRSVTDRQERGAMMLEAVANYEYTINASEKSFWLLPQMRLEAGRMYLQMGRKSEAVNHFARAVAANPSYLPAYLPLIDVYKELGSPQSALDVATSGLRHIPDSKSLQKAYTSLGGKLPYPEPLSRPGSKAQPAGEEKSATREDGVDSPPTDPEKANSDLDSSVEAQPESGQDALQGCRFCPPESIQKRWRDSFGETSSGK